MYDDDLTLRACCGNFVRDTHLLRRRVGEDLERKDQLSHLDHDIARCMQCLLCQALSNLTSMCLPKWRPCRGK